MAGRVVTSNKLRIGYFAQHQVDELFVDETPLDHIRSLRREKRLHAARHLGICIGAEQLDAAGRLSGDSGFLLPQRLMPIC